MGEEQVEFFGGHAEGAPLDRRLARNGGSAAAHSRRVWGREGVAGGMGGDSGVAAAEGGVGMVAGWVLRGGRYWQEGHIM